MCTGFRRIDVMVVGVGYSALIGVAFVEIKSGALSPGVRRALTIHFPTPG